MKKNKRGESQPNLSIIIAAAGNSRRMKSYGSKSLIELTEKENVISRQINSLKKLFKNAEFIVVVGFQAEKVIRKLPNFVKVVENEFFEDTGIVRSIGMATRITSYNNLLVLPNDIIFNKETLINLDFSSSFLIAAPDEQVKDDDVGITVVDGNLINMAFGLKKKWAQILYLTNKEVDLFKKFVQDREKRKLNLFEIINLILDKNGQFKVIEPVGMKMVEIENYKDIEKARNIF